MKYPVLFIAALLVMAALIAGCTQQAASQQTTPLRASSRSGSSHR